jgi:hypothetical protein
MNPIELYKKLPKKNCGECPQKTCMPFALSVIKGEAQLSECPLLPSEDADRLKGCVTKSDWREELIVKLGQEIKGLDFAQAAANLGGELSGNSLLIKCLGREFIITPDGEVSTKGHITPWVKILLLYYIKFGGRGEQSGKWVSFSDLKAGMIKSTAFKRDCEDPLKDIFDRDFQEASIALMRLGAEKQDGESSVHTWTLFLLPKIPVRIFYWPKEEEFDSKLKMVFDSTADKFLDSESLIFLSEGLVKNVEMMTLTLDKRQ